MPSSNSKNKPSYTKDLILLFAIPIAIALIAVGMAYIPRLLANPSHDFVYSVCDSYRCSNDFSVNESGTITEQLALTDSNRPIYTEKAKLYYFDVSNNSSRRLTLEEAQNYQLNTSSRSPDGYILDRANSSSGFLFWSDYDNNWYLKNGAKKTVVELSGGASYRRDNINFLGWVGQ